MQVGLVARKPRSSARASAIEHVVDGPLVDAFHAALPFALTDGQERRPSPRSRATSPSPAPMHR